jgi:hypothetical protein
MFLINLEVLKHFLHLVRNDRNTGNLVAGYYRRKFSDIWDTASHKFLVILAVWVDADVVGFPELAVLVEVLLVVVESKSLVEHYLQRTRKQQSP